VEWLKLKALNSSTSTEKNTHQIPIFTNTHMGKNEYNTSPEKKGWWSGSR
jgi:hypothetical protein